MSKTILLVDDSRTALMLQRMMLEDTGFEILTASNGREGVEVATMREPDLIVSVNTDGSCPMSSMAELNLVTDGRALLIALADRLGVDVEPDLRDHAMEAADA